jgi:hypothetical protein
MYSSASSKSHQSERLKIIDADSGKRIPFDYDRSALENDIGATQQLNKTFLQLLLPDVIERRCTDPSFWGEERHPHWISR